MGATDDEGREVEVMERAPLDVPRVFAGAVVGAAIKVPPEAAAEVVLASMVAVEDVWMAGKEVAAATVVGAVVEVGAVEGAEAEAEAEEDEAEAEEEAEEEGALAGDATASSSSTSAVLVMVTSFACMTVVDGRVAG